MTREDAHKALREAGVPGAVCIQESLWDYCASDKETFTKYTVWLSIYNHNFYSDSSLQEAVEAAITYDSTVKKRMKEMEEGPVRTPIKKYDILQLLDEDRVWKDYATIRGYDDYIACLEADHEKFRIRTMSGKIVNLKTDFYYWPEQG